MSDVPSTVDLARFFHGQNEVPMETTDRPSAGVVWARVEEGFHVGSRRGVFLGYIDRQPDGSFLAVDGRSRVIGTFPALTAAMAAVTNGQPPHDEEILLEQVRVPSAGSLGTGGAL